MNTVQIRPCKLDEHGHAIPADHHLDFYSVYIGEEGDWMWVADFKFHSDATRYAVHLVTIGYVLHDTTPILHRH